MVDRLVRVPVPIREVSPEKRQASRAMGVFVDVSRKSPASVTAQAARIAEYCAKRGEVPSELLTSLICDDDLIRKLVRTANKAHFDHQKKVQINSARVVSILQSEALLADKLMLLDASDLQSLYSHWYAFYLKTQSATCEFTLRKHANNLIEIAQETLVA